MPPSSSSPTHGKKAIVIGAGVGGVSTAARLAKAGFSVTVLEKNNFTGGRCSLIHHDGYRFDQGPSLLLLPHLFHATFSDLGTTLLDEGVQLLKCDPNYRIHFGDGEKFTLSTDLSVMKDEIEKWEGKDGYDRYLAFLRESHAHYELSVTHVLLKNFTSLLSMLRISFLRHLLALHPFESIWARASCYFWTERLRRVFTFGSMYMGMSPFDAPGTYSLLQYTELAEGIWYPVGGFHRVVEALVGIAERLGAEFRLQTAVKRICVTKDGKRATGVELESGEILEADVVVNNSDLVYAYNHLLQPEAYAESLSDRPGSCSSISFYWALDRKVPELEAHNIFLADDYRESFDSIFKKHLIPDEPSFYVNVPSRVDSSAAPAGKDSVVVLVPVGHLTGEAAASHYGLATSPSPNANGHANGHANGNATIASKSPKSQPGIVPTPSQDWPAMIALARQTIISTIKTRTGVDLNPLIIHEESNDPMTWRARFNLDKGAILGLSHSFFNVLCFRPSTRARRGGALDVVFQHFGIPGRILEVLVDAFRPGKDMKGLYMVGASAHPGTGVPIVLAGGKLVSEQICGDMGIQVPWLEERDREVEGKKVNRLDKMERPDTWFRWISMVVVLGAVPWMLGWVVVLFLARVEGL